MAVPSKNLSRPEILLVEDNPADAYLIFEALREAGASLQLAHVDSGEEALLFLRRQAPFEDAHRPRLVMLDLNLPGISGSEVLKEIRHDPQLTRMPVLVLSSSGAQKDVDMAYGLHANCYVRKPGDFDDYISLLRLVEQLWFRFAKLPNGQQ